MPTQGSQTFDKQFGPFNFSDALNFIKSGNFITRSGWNGKDMYCALQVPDEHSANTLPYIYFITVQGQRVPWVASQTDLLAEDWHIYPKP